MKIRPLDILLISVSLLVVGAFALYAYTGKGKSSTVVIEASGKRYLYPLGQDRVVKVPGPIGETVVDIRDGRAFVEDSPCRDKLCVHMGSISKPGQWVACLPNKVMVSIGDGGVKALDDVSY
jgi:hypothetical protein